MRRGPTARSETLTTVRTTPSPTPACARPSTETAIIPSTTSGSMYLSIDNQNDEDAMITLRVASTPPESGRKVLSFYLRAHDSYTVRTIGTGTYTLWYKLGECWDPSATTFAVNRGAHRFDDLLEYTYDTEGYDAKIYGVVSGNALTTNVPPDQV